MIFAWDELNLEHIAKHAVTAAEAEDVVAGAQPPYPCEMGEAQEMNMPKKTKIDENDFDALDRLARNLTPAQLRPLSPAKRQRWQAAKRGRPRKDPDTKAVPTMITVDPALLHKIDQQARRRGISRSQFLADAARRELRKAG